MPLIKRKSKEAFEKNLKTEIAAGKPKNAALAIAYRVQNEASMKDGGFVGGPTAGRSDKVPVAVKTNSYVIPADVVSGIGQGNSLAGATALSRMFKMGPYGTKMPRGKTPKKGFADGGEVDMTDIQISDGEFSVPPEKVLEIGGGDMEKGHALLDGFVKHMRKKTIKSLESLPGPKNG